MASRQRGADETENPRAEIPSISSVTARQAVRMAMISQHFYNPAFTYFAMLSPPDHATQFCLQRK